MGDKCRSRKSGREKLENPPEGLPKVITVPKEWEKRMGGKRVLVPTPLTVVGLVRKVGKGKLVTVGQLRERLAMEFDADSTCPMTMGIFLMIVAQAAEEDLLAGRMQITPYWRVVRSDGSLNPKFQGGVQAQAARLKEEGHKIVAGKGKKPPRVQDFEKVLV